MTSKFQLNKIESWPTWFRWLLFIPTAFVAGTAMSVLGLLFFSFFSWFFLGITSLTPWVHAISYAVFGYFFVKSGAWMAPGHKFTCSIVLFILAILYGLLGIALIHTKDPSPTIFEMVLVNVALMIFAGMATFDIRKERK